MKATLLGLSGVGKGYLLTNLSRRRVINHLVASDLLKAGLRRRSSSEVSSEQLRTGEVAANQAILVSEWKLQANGGLPVVLDAHSVIDTGCGVLPIAPEVFAAMKLDHIFFLRDDPLQIARRRELDASRVRPLRSVEELAEHQEAAIHSALAIAAETALPLTIITHEHVALLEHLLTASLSPPLPPC